MATEGLALDSRRAGLLHRNPLFERLLARAPNARALEKAAKRSAKAMALLTDRELEVAILLALGASNRDVAGDLGIAAHTAKRHTESVLKKLQVGSRSKVAARILGVPPAGKQ